MEGVAAITCSDGRWDNNKPSCKGTVHPFLSPPYPRAAGEASLFQARYREDHLSERDRALYCFLNLPEDNISCS